MPFITNLKKLACASKQDVLELVTLRYIFFFVVMQQKMSIKAKNLYQKPIFSSFLHLTSWLLTSLRQGNRFMKKKILEKKLKWTKSLLRILTLP
jgi:hypothetical protein